MNITQDELKKLVKENLKYYSTGHNATYIPALANVKAKQLGISYYDLAKKELIQAGEANEFFAIESISKVIVLMLAILDNGKDFVFEKVDMEPSSFPFNSILPMQIQHEHKPNNPFINAGAIVTTSLIKGIDPEDKFNRILVFAHEVCNDDEIYLNTTIYESEARTGDTNRSLAYYLKSINSLEGDVHDTLDVYFKQCSLMVTTKSLAHLGALLANNGVAPWNDKRIIDEDVAVIIKSLMLTGGLYNESGSFSFYTGMPTKSGVGGGLMTAMPNIAGIGVFSPPLNVYGNSSAGTQLLKVISKKYKLNIFI